MQTNFPKWIYVVGGLGVVGLAAWTGSKWGAWLVIITVFAMLSAAYARGEWK
jgi:hypothetical protein